LYSELAPFKNLGAGPRGGRVKRALPPWMPPKRKVWNDKQPQNVIEAIHAAAYRHCPTSPCNRDEFRRRLGKGHWESARSMFRHDTRNEYWAWFCEDSRNTASKIASMEYPEEAPRAFRDHHELDKAYEGGDSCLCVPVRQCRSWRQRPVQLRFFAIFWIAWPLLRRGTGRYTE
jgi:hypothetical protein